MLRVMLGVMWMAAAVGLVSSAAAQGPNPEIQTVESATAVLNEIMTIQVSSIPHKMLADCHGVAIVPNVIKGGLVVGARYGKGVVVVRDANGNWLPPSFVTLTGGSVGWQIGLQATDVILVFRTQKSVENLLKGKFTIGADAAAAAGPVGRQAAAATDAQLKAEILSYSRSRGLFAGVSLDGTAIQINQTANDAYYAGTGIAAGGAPVPAGQQVQWPASALTLVETIVAYSQGKQPPGVVAAPGAIAGVPGPAGYPAAPVANPAGFPVQPAAPLPDMPGFPAPLPPVLPAAPAAYNVNVNAFRQQLAEQSQQLAPLLDDNWRAFLATSSVVTVNGAINLDALKTALTRYDNVAQNPNYVALTQRAEFRTIHQTLGRTFNLVGNARPALNLPPPPIVP